MRDTEDLGLITRILVGVNIFIFMLGILSGGIADFLYDHGMFVTERVFSGHEYHRILTSLFLHADSGHLFSNMAALLYVGNAVESSYGRRDFLFIYLLSGILGNFTSAVVETVLGVSWASLGASGCIFGLMGALLIAAIPRRRSALSSILEAGGEAAPVVVRRVSRITPLRVGIMALYSLYMGFLSPNTNNAAHLGGLIGGLIVGAGLRFLGGSYNEEG